MSKKPYDLGERDKPTRGLAAHFRAKWMQADRRIRELEAEVARLTPKRGLAADFRRRWMEAEAKLLAVADEADGWSDDYHSARDCAAAIDDLLKEGAL